MNVTLTIHLHKGYIGNPYWPEMEKVINIRKQSGVDRARSEAKRSLALSAWLSSHNMTMDDYRVLETQAARPFYTNETGEIVIPAHHWHGFMASAAAVAPASIRLAKPEQIRNIVEWQDMPTGKTKPDELWERFVKNALTNQRRLQSNHVITDVTATGTLHLVNPELEKKAKEFISWGGAEIGIGAARKMGWGRFTITAWKAQA